MATNTTNTFTNHTGNNTAGPFSISFDYLAESEVVVSVDGVTKTQTTHYTFPSATTISFTSGNHPANSAAIKFQRNTSVSAKKVDFQDGSVLTESDLDTSTDQVIYSLQEILDGGVGSDTTYAISCVDGDNTDEEKIRLTAGGSGSGTDDVVLEAGTGLSIARSGDKITFTNTVTDTNTQLTTEEVQDIIGAMIAGNTETNISVTYDDTNGKLNFASTDTNYSVQDGQLSQNNFTNTLKTKLDGIEASADVTDATNVNSAGAVMNSDLDGKGEILIGDGSGDPTALSVGTNNYVLTADSSETTGVKWAAASGGGGGGGTTNLSNTANGTSLTVESSSGNNTSLPAATTSAWGVMTDDDKTKIDGIETSATADQTNAEIRTAVEAASDSNVFTDADHTKLNAIEASATADQTGAEIKTAYEAESDTNAYTDAEKTKLSGIATSANNYSISSDLLDEDNMASNSATKAASQQSIKSYVDTNSVALADNTTISYQAGSGTAANGITFKVKDGSNDSNGSSIELNATDGAIELIGNETSGVHTYLDFKNNSSDDYHFRIAADTNGNLYLHTPNGGALYHQPTGGSAAQLSTSGGETNQNAFSNVAVSGQTTVAADSKTDTLTLAAGSNVTITTTDGTDTVTIASTDTNTTDLASDSSPQLGGNLDVQGREINTSTTNGNIVLNPNGEFGVVRIKGDSTNSVDGTLELRCSSDSHGVKIKSPPHSAAQNYTLTLPSSIVNGAFLKTDSNGGLSFATPTDTNTTYSAGTGLSLSSTTFNLDTITSVGTISTGTWQGTAIASTYVGNLAASKITSGTFDAARIPTLNQNTTGSAATLTTARAINGVNFDGSAAITVADSTKIPTAGGTFTGTVIFQDAINENVFAITDGNAAIDPDNGTIQTWTLGANRTPTDSLTAGQSVLLMITAGSYTITWPTITWAGGSAPTLSTSSKTAIEFWKVGSTLYGANVGDV